MNFLTPLFLIGGLALAGPLIFHLIRRTTRERTVFSSLMFLLPTPPRLSKRSKLEHLLLLALRCLALALLALGFARPFLKNNPPLDPTAAPPKRTVILVDTSASMRRAGAWDAARERVDAVLRRAAPTDEVALYAFDRAATALVSFEEWGRAAPGGRAALVTGRLASAAPSWHGTHLGTALIAAAEALAESDGKRAPGPRQIILVSDLQAGSRLDALQAYEWPKGVALTVEAITARRSTNAGLQLVAEALDAPRTAETVVRVRVTNSADAQREQFQVGWARAETKDGFVGKPLDAYVPPGQSRIVALPVPKDAAGLDRIVLRGDDEDFDNTVYVVPPVPQKATVLWFGADAPEDARQPLFFVRRALASVPRFVVRVDALAPAAPLAPGAAREAAVVFVAEALPETTVAELRAAALAGKTIVFAPKTAAAVATLGAVLGGAAVGATEAKVANYAMFADIDFQHPLFAPFADPKFSDFTKIRFWKYRKLDAAQLPGARALAKFDNGDPALLEVPLGAGRVLVFAGGWQPEDSQLAVSSKFVPLMQSLLEIAAGAALAPAQAFFGDELPKPAGEGATLRGPLGAPVAMTAAVALAQPGIHELTVAVPASTTRFAVNLDPNESRTAPLGVDELERLGLPVMAPVDPKALPAAAVELLQAADAENRQKLWRWLLVAALGVLLIESIFAGWTARRQIVTTPETPSP
jgi:GNAT superfamily N-acetyltransferase